jgi:hypothetical protein
VARLIANLARQRLLANLATVTNVRRSGESSQAKFWRWGGSFEAGTLRRESRRRVSRMSRLEGVGGVINAPFLTGSLILRRRLLLSGRSFFEISAALRGVLTSCGVRFRALWPGPIHQLRGLRAEVTCHAVTGRQSFITRVPTWSHGIREPFVFERHRRV